MRGYRLKRPNGSWTPVIDEQDFDRSVHRRAKLLEGPVRLRENGGDPGPFLALPTGVERLLKRAHGADVGYHSGLLNAKHKGILCRVVQDAPDAANTLGSPGVDIVVGFLNAEFAGQWESWGCYVYKHIAGSSTWSDHSYVNHTVRPEWCGRAIDCHPHSMEIGDRMKVALLAEESIVANLRYLLWRVPDHYDHLHLSMDDPGAPGYC